MVWTHIETDFFFLDATQMVLSILVKAAIYLEGIIEVYDLLDFDYEQRKTVISNLKNTASTTSFARPKYPPVPIWGISYAIGARSLSRLKVSSESGCYYDLIGRTTVPVNMSWTTLS